MKYSEFLKKVAIESCVSQVTVKRVLDATKSVIKDAVKSGEEVTLHGVGKFDSKIRSARVGVNPVTREKVDIPETKIVTFKVAKDFKDYINN